MAGKTRHRLIGGGGFWIPAHPVQISPDPELRDYESVPLKEDIVEFFLREVRPFVPDAWIDRNTTDEKDGQIGKVG